MPTENLEAYSTDEIAYLLAQARQALVLAGGGTLYTPQPTLSARLLEDRACFITLTVKGRLRGCIGTILARMPLYQEVVYSTYQSALHDYRFSPVTAAEIPTIRIEISILTPPRPLDYHDTNELVNLLHPEIDGVILRYGNHTGTFLPQVWERIPDTSEFLAALCHKMGLSRDFWQHNPMGVEIYQARKYFEPD